MIKLPRAVWNGEDWQLADSWSQRLAFWWHRKKFAEYAAKTRCMARSHGWTITPNHAHSGRA